MAMAIAVGARDEDVPESSRPRALLPWRQLALISAYWFGINAVWGAYEGFGQKQVELLVGRDSTGLALGVLEALGALVAIAVQPTIGSISDYTTSRFGKRKGYIITGTIFDLIFISGFSLIALAQPPGRDGQALGSTGLLALYVVLLLGLQVSSNFAQGPYQGYVPDLVAEPQVGLASGAIGVMRTTGNIFGFGVMAVGAAVEEWGLAFLAVGVVEVVLAVLTFVFVQEGPAGKTRGRRSWRSVALEAWGTDILRERSFLLMTGVRFLFLMGTGAFVNLSLLYVERTFGVTDPFERSAWWMGALVAAVVGVVVAAIPAARTSDRVGRKPVAWAAIGIAASGTLVLALAPVPAVALLGALLFGAGSGAYLAVDWALMTDIIPLASSGRFMGIANIANSISGPLAVVIVGPVMDAFTRAGQTALGPRVAVGLGIVALTAAAILLIGVHPRRDPRSAEVPVFPAS
jgi:MFS family permease